MYKYSIKICHKKFVLGKNGQFSRIFKMGENIKEKVSKSPTNVELVHKPGTFF